ncbi:DUF7535 family protein [Halanaeroarchaeum sulfurireducens]|uniref:DUF7535 family protein n=1 Tax=Halanaeroarchaeum sulfurireducens TaxID=1604004 RepID=UPI00067956D0|nr:hypothetical protein [Halanaeroarchaeum sulfurireducens]
MTDSVTQPTPWHHAPEMSAFGIIIAAGIALVLLPLWPFLAILYVAGRLKESKTIERNVAR